jgi:glutathione synthase
VNVLFVMDPMERIDPTGDTTSALMEAAQAAGHELWATELHLLEANPAPAALARRVDVTPWFGVGAPERVAVNAVDAVFIRSDPPFDDRYLWAMHILDLADRARTVFVNDPAGIRAANEKLYALRFPRLIPPTLITADGNAIERFVARHGAAVVKPVDGHAGRGVVRLDRGDANLRSIVELQTGRGDHPAVVQAFVENAGGNHRIFVLDGEPLATVTRLPVAGDFRTGDVAEVVELTPEERRLCDDVGPALVADGLRFVGLDVIGGRLIEVNVTSPGGVRQLEKLSGRRYAPLIVDRLLAAAHQPMEVMV